MSNFKKAEESIAGSLRGALRSLFAALAALFSMQPALVVVVASCVCYVFYIGLTTLHSTSIYTVSVAALYLILGCILYTQKGAIEATVTLAVGLFTAFTVSWNTEYFTIFSIAIVLFMILILALSAIKLASQVETSMVMAANLYIHQDTKRNKQELEDVRKSISFPGTLMPIERVNALLYFAQRKVPADVMKKMIRDLNEICTVTQTEQVSVQLMLYGIYKSGPNMAGLEANVDAVKNFLLEGPASPQELVDSFNHTSVLINEKNLTFSYYLGKLSDGLSRGYSQEWLFLYIEED
jgi:hypothetical protein